MSSLKHECAVCGVMNTPDAADLVVTGLIALQHRGHEWWGIAHEDSGCITVHKYPGLVKDSCERPEIVGITSSLAMGHDRYSTAGASTAINAQPHAITDGRLAICANGDIVPSSYESWHRKMIEVGCPPISQNDAELMLRILEHRLKQGDDIVDAIRFVQDNVIGAFSALVIFEGELIAFRDKLGMRPMVYGTANDGKVFMVASETCALNIMEADAYDYIRAGEIYVFHNDGTYDRYDNPSDKHAHCIFDVIYFSRPDSDDYGIPVCEFRKRSGAEFATDLPEGVDLIMPVPDSSNYAAIGLAQASGVPFDMGIVRSHYTGRSFTAPDQKTRKAVAKQKHTPNPYVVKGKKLVVVDDSIVRATTIRELIARLFKAGALEIHVRIVSPPVAFSCYYGIDTPRREELIAARLSIPEICQEIGATSLKFLTIEQLHSVVASFGKPPEHHCYACFTGDYPTPL
ncbi:MAG TPA: amidophosphoribosyltransferase [Candidatus Saccharimonadales bacterium]|nr:amidophosphoribosyltransferase [Candidatus Saccharimonadales bacterium]